MAGVKLDADGTPISKRWAGAQRDRHERQPARGGRLGLHAFQTSRWRAPITAVTSAHERVFSIPELN